MNAELLAAGDLDGHLLKEAIMSAVKEKEMRDRISSIWVTMQLQ